MDQKAFQEYLATGKCVAAMDAAPKKKRYTDLASHDRRFHPQGFDPERDRCEVRAALAKGDKSDDGLAAAERKEQDSAKGGKLEHWDEHDEKWAASRRYDPPAALGDDSIWSLAKTDPDAEEAGRIAGELNRKNGWGISDDEVSAYVQAFRDMDDGKFPYGLPEFEGRLTEENFNEGDFSGESKGFRDLAALCARRPDLIRPYVIERLTDANFHKEAEELQSGAYRSRTAQDAAVARYLKAK